MVISAISICAFQVCFVVKGDTSGEITLGEMFTEANFTVTLPGGSRVNNVNSSSSKSEYFDLNGRRVSNPAKGGIYILRNGEKVEKIIK